MLTALWTALAATAPALLVCALAATIIGLVVALAEHHKVMPTWIVATASIAVLLFLFYPRVILSSTLLLLLGKATSAHFAQSVWGFGLAAIPAAAGLAYLVFSLTLQLEHYSRTSASYLQNARRPRLLTLLPVAAIPFHAWFSATLLITFSIMSFQGAMLGSARPYTVGVYLNASLKNNEITLADRLVAGGLTLALLILFVVAVPLAWRWLATRLSRLPLALPSLPTEKTRRRSLRGAARRVVGFVSIAVLVISMTIHVGLLLRLFGALPSPFESSAAHIDLTFVANAFKEAFDSGVFGALVGAILIFLLWFFALSRSLAVSRRVRSVAPLTLGVLAFIPSSFVGALLLLSPLSNPHLMLGWGALSSGALVALLISGHVFARKLYRYDNLRRIRGLLAGVGHFFREYWRTLIALGFLAALFNAVDPGLREQLGESGLPGIFASRIGGWSPEVRGLALVLCLVMTLLVLLLRYDQRRLPVSD